jgi:OOP family OmpA-OmpF porin
MVSKEQKNGVNMNNTKFMSKFFLVPLLCVSAGNVYGWQEGQGYVTASIGNTNVDESDVDFDSDSTSFRIGGGYRIVRNFAVEAYYINYGEADQSYPNEAAFAGVDDISISVESTAIQFQALGIFPVSEYIDLNAKAGLTMWDAEACVSARLGTISDSECADDDGSDLVYGFGATYNFSQQVAGRLEYEIADFDGTDVTTLMFGLNYGF